MTKRIIYTRHDGGVSVVIPSTNSKLTIVEIADKDVPDGVSFEIVDTVTIPSERMFRDAWEKSGKDVVTDIIKAKILAHGMRRTARDEEMRPLDIKATIPSEAVAAEAERVLIRNKYNSIQMNIDSAIGEDDLLLIVKSM